jgi:uncharacterized spore protein YtfJ
MDVQAILEQARDSITVKRVFGDPYERDGTLVVPVARIRGGGGGGSGPSEQGSNQRGGAGFGFMARPAGVYVIKGGDVTWQPALDVNRVILGGQIVGIAALLLTWSLLRLLLRARARARRQSPSHPAML